MTLTRGFIRNAATTPLDARLMDMGGLVCNADGSPRAGVLGGANPSIVTALATMNVAVAAAEFVTTKGKADGVAIFANDGTVNVAIGAAPASNSRIDVIYVKHNDNTTGDANSNPIFGVQAGVPAASPTKPAIPTGALELATLRVYAGTMAANGGSNTLVNTYAMTAARGGVVPFRTKTELDAWTTATDGQLVYVLAEDATYQYLATAPTPGWVHAGGVPASGGTVTITAGGAGFANGTPAPRLRYQGGRYYLEGTFGNNVSAAFGAGSAYSIGSIPVAAAPVADRRVPISTNGPMAVSLIIAATGALSLVTHQAFTGTAVYALDGASWADKRLG